MPNAITQTNRLLASALGLSMVVTIGSSPVRADLFQVDEGEEQYGEVLLNPNDGGDLGPIAGGNHVRPDTIISVDRGSWEIRLPGEYEDDKRPDLGNGAFGQDWLWMHRWERLEYPNGGGDLGPIAGGDHIVPDTIISVDRGSWEIRLPGWYEDDGPDLGNGAFGQDWLWMHRVEILEYPVDDGKPDPGPIAFGNHILPDTIISVDRGSWEIRLPGWYEDDGPDLDDGAFGRDALWMGSVENIEYPNDGTIPTPGSLIIILTGAGLVSTRRRR